MDIEQIRDYCISKAGTTEEFPFDKDTLVFKVMGKMFALCGLEHQPLFINLKCDPDRAVELREQYDCIQPAYHMNKKHWNSVYIESGELSRNELLELIDHSYQLVVSKLPKKVKAEL